MTTTLAEVFDAIEDLYCAFGSDSDPRVLKWWADHLEEAEARGWSAYDLKREALARGLAVLAEREALEAAARLPGPPVPPAARTPLDMLTAAAEAERMAVGFPYDGAPGVPISEETGRPIRRPVLASVRITLNSRFVQFTYLGKRISRARAAELLNP